MTPPRSPNGHHTPTHEEAPPLESAETGHGDYEGVTMTNNSDARGDGIDDFLASQPQAVRDATAEWERGHISASGQRHHGTRESCITIECLPPAIPVREGDVVRVVGQVGAPDSVGLFRVAASREIKGVVTLQFDEVSG